MALDIAEQLRRIFRERRSDLVKMLMDEAWSRAILTRKSFGIVVCENYFASSRVIGFALALHAMSHVVGERAGFQEP